MGRVRYAAGAGLGKKSHVKKILVLRVERHFFGKLATWRCFTYFLFWLKRMFWSSKRGSEKNRCFRFLRLLAATCVWQGQEWFLWITAEQNTSIGMLDYDCSMWTGRVIYVSKKSPWFFRCVTKILRKKKFFIDFLKERTLKPLSSKKLRNKLIFKPLKPS